jgi:low temperature requirement protein LtrA
MNPFKIASARNPDEEHRVATPLELFFDLVYVIAIASAASGLHHQLLKHQIAYGIGWYIFAFWAIWWCWVNYTWYASAFDTDDTVYRLFTFIQIFGALVLAVGIKNFFQPQHNLVLALIGYIIMRFAMVLHWLRVGVSLGKRYKKVAYRYAFGVTVVQVLWIFNYLFAGEFFIYISAILVIAEMSVPVIAEQNYAEEGTPWHPHHIAERYGLLVIIVLGEGILATTTTIASLISSATRWQDAFPLGFGAAGLVFALWWSYFRIPFGKILHQNKTSLSISLIFGYGHYFLFASLAAVDVGLQLVANAAAHIQGNNYVVSPQFALICTSAAVATYLLFMSLYRTLLIKKVKYNWCSYFVAILLPGIPILVNYLGVPLYWAIWFSVLAPAAFIFLN